MIETNIIQFLYDPDRVLVGYIFIRRFPVIDSCK
jgi:hypothetical protein